MEKAAGVPLFERWGAMPDIEKLELIKHLTQFEAQLSALSFPAYGGLYLKSDVDSVECRDLDKDIDQAGLFYIGPSPERSFGVDSAAPSTALDRGPCEYPKVRR